MKSAHSAKKDGPVFEFGVALVNLGRGPLLTDIGRAIAVCERTHELLNLPFNGFCPGLVGRQEGVGEICDVGWKGSGKTGRTQPSLWTRGWDHQPENNHALEMRSFFGSTCLWALEDLGVLWKEWRGLVMYVDESWAGISQSLQLFVKLWKVPSNVST